MIHVGAKHILSPLIRRDNEQIEFEIRLHAHQVRHPQ